MNTIQIFTLAKLAGTWQSEADEPVTTPSTYGTARRATLRECADVLRMLCEGRFEDSHPAEGKQHGDEAEIAGLRSAVAHLSNLVDEQRKLLVDVEDICGRDGFGDPFEDGESSLIDRVRAHLAMTAPPADDKTGR